MKVVFLNQPLVFSCIPRAYPTLGETLLLSLRNELTDVVITPNITYTVDELLNVTITSQPTDFAIENKYEMTIYNNSNIIYMGQLSVLKNGTDLQNYKYKNHSDGGFEYKS